MGKVHVSRTCNHIMARTYVSLMQGNRMQWQPKKIPHCAVILFPGSPPVCKQKWFSVSHYECHKIPRSVTVTCLYYLVSFARSAGLLIHINVPIEATTLSQRPHHSIPQRALSPNRTIFLFWACRAGVPLLARTVIGVACRWESHRPLRLRGQVGAPPGRPIRPQLSWRPLYHRSSSWLPTNTCRIWEGGHTAAECSQYPWSWVELFGGRPRRWRIPEAVTANGDAAERVEKPADQAYDLAFSHKPDTHGENPENLCSRNSRQWKRSFGCGRGKVGRVWGCHSASHLHGNEEYGTNSQVRREDYIRRRRSEGGCCWNEAFHKTARLLSHIICQTGCIAN